MKKLLLLLIIPFLSFGQDVSKTTPCDCAEMMSEAFFMGKKIATENPHLSEDEQQEMLKKAFDEYVRKNKTKGDWCEEKTNTDLKFKKKYEKCLDKKKKDWR